MRRSHRPPLRSTLAEAVAFIRPAPELPVAKLLAGAPRGDGHAVLVLPALLRGDPYTVGVRDLLTQLGYLAFGWGLGVNTGPTRHALDGSLDRLSEISGQQGPVSIVGFSLGGLFARWLSQQRPHLVRQVITVCSPVHDAASRFWLPLQPLLRFWRGTDLKELADAIAQPLPVPLTCVFSRNDGIVHWQSCYDASAPSDDVIEIAGPHALIARDPQVIEIVAERLARPLTPSRMTARLPCATT